MKLSERAMIRKRAGLTQHQLAKYTGIHACRISLWENDEVNLNALEISKIVDAIANELNRHPLGTTSHEVAQVVGPASAYASASG